LDERQKVRVKNDYDQLLQNTTAPGSKKFRYMKIDPDGFGGVILGNKVSARKSVGRLKNVVWIHEDAAGGSKTGRLEFIFHDSATKILPGVLWEDVYAAYNIIFVENKHSLFDREEGIGLVSGTYPKVYNEDRVFDSLVMSHGLTENEINYYKFLCNFQQLFTPLSLKIKNDDQRLTELDALYEEAAAKGDLSARNTIRSEYNNILEERQRAYSEYSLLSPIYRDSLAYWKTHYSMVVKNVHNYISKCNKIIIHPAIANLELGRCLVRADVHPRAGLQMLDRIKGTGIDQTKLELLRNWLSGTDSVGWKFTDDSLLISATGGIVLVTRKNNPASAESRAGLLNFNKINVKGAKVTSTDFTEFYKMFPLLVRNYYDYHRLNNFTKLMAIFRWAKRSKASFLNKPQAPPMYNAPGYIKITDEGSVKIIDMYPCR